MRGMKEEMRRQWMYGRTAAEMLYSLPRMTVTGSGRLAIENHSGIRSFSPECVCVDTSVGRIECRGCGLTVEELDRSELLVTGNITSIRLPDAEDE